MKSEMLKHSITNVEETGILWSALIFYRENQLGVDDREKQIIDSMIAELAAK